MFVFKVWGALTMAAGAQITLTGAQASHVFWQVNAAAAVGAGDKFAGTLMAHDAAADGRERLERRRLASCADSP